MNDKVEGVLLTDKLFALRKNSKEYNELYQKIIDADGEVFIMAFSRSREATPNGNISMWTTYGDTGKGVMLRFDYNKLKSYVKDYKNYKLSECSYINSTEVNNNAKEWRDKLESAGPDMLEQTMSDFIYSAHKYKEEHWNHEEEWRLMVRTTYYKFRMGKYGITPYAEIRIPIECLTGITIGPLAEQELAERSLNLLIKKVNEKSSLFNAKVYKSKIQIR